MRKIFTILAAALISVSAMAVNGVNIFASGLKASVQGDLTKMNIGYTLNTPATSLEVEFFDADQEIMALVEITDAELLTEGRHFTTIDLPIDDLEEGTFSWAIHAYAGTTVFENKLAVGDPRYSFYLPQDIVVDNSFESDFFGRIYVSESCDGADDGGTLTTKEQKRGLFVLDPTLQTVNGGDAANVGFDGGLGGDRETRAAFKRLAIDEKGFVYVASRDADIKGVYRANPADLSAPFETVLAASAAVDAVEVVDGKLVTIEGLGGDDGGFIKTYDLSSIPVAEPSKAWSAGELTLVNSDESIRSDRRGGYWIIQNRWALDGYPALSHLTKKGARDFVVDVENNTELLSNSNGNLTYRGTLGVSVDGSKLAISSNKEAVVFSVDWTEEGTPVLTKLCETPVIGGNIDGVAFDVADNLYVASASVEQFHLYPISKEAGSNHSRVFAPSKYNITVGVETGVENTAVKSAPVKMVRDGQVIIIRNGVEFNLLGAQVK